MDAQRVDRKDREDRDLYELTEHLRSARLLLTAEMRPGSQAARDDVDLAMLDLCLLLDRLPDLRPAPVQPGITWHLQKAERLIRRLPNRESNGAAELVKEALWELGR